jgi:hypothetical protein
MLPYNHRHDQCFGTLNVLHGMKVYIISSYVLLIFQLSDCEMATDNRQFVFKINVTAQFIRVISLVTSVPGHRTSEGSWYRWDYETPTCFERARLPPRYNYSVVDLDSMCTVFSAKGWNINPYSTLHIFAPKRSLIY